MRPAARNISTLHLQGRTIIERDGSKPETPGWKPENAWRDYFSRSIYCLADWAFSEVGAIIMTWPKACSAPALFLSFM